MTNTNCLENIARPQCGNDERFRIAVTAMADVTDDGAEVTGDIEWDDRSVIVCPDCHLNGSVTQFGSTDDRTLPPDPDGMNGRRAIWAGKAIAAFREATGTDEEDALGDLLTDLRHWADRNGYDFEAAELRAESHYEAETTKNPSDFPLLCKSTLLFIRENLAEVTDFHVPSPVIEWLDDVFEQSWSEGRLRTG